MINNNQRKRQFIEYLLQKYHHVNPTVTYLLNYLKTQPNTMDSIIFTENVKYAPRGIYISYQQSTQVPFVYYKDQLSYTMCEQAFHDIRLNSKFNQQKFYLELNIPDYFQQLYYLDIFEENPFLPENEELIQSTDVHLERLSIEANIQQLSRKLDAALEKHQFEEVSYYLKQIEQLRGELNEN
ncbi:YpiB family protein [Fundicoccus ignavus]|uniref:YpiB family protein n=1 Tax=Fundicoccus ignavus TaxID=2664442 RepID=UPI00129C299F|nr:YpiB family protein [Fundicoccus ignavus]